MPVGHVKWFNESKGFGFIQSEIEQGRDIFVHYSSIMGNGFKTLAEGEKVQFELVQGPKGPLATKVEKAEGQGDAVGNASSYEAQPTAS